MSTIVPEPTAPPVDAVSPDTDGRNPWLVPLVALTSIVALGDVVFMALIPSPIPPLVAGVALTLIGIALVRRRRGAAVVVLGLTSAALAIAGIAFLSSHLTHPGSPIDFLHAVLAIIGRALAVVAAVGAWRGGSTSGARRLAATALGLAGLAVAVSGIATLLTDGEPVRDGDVPVAITGSQFPATIVVERGQTLHIDNQDLFRHTFTAPATELDVDLPASTAARATVDLPAGSYDVICDVAGHEHMTAHLEVRP
jgi:plastocyanin